jgi:hypothetical protein
MKNNPISTPVIAAAAVLLVLVLGYFGYRALAGPGQVTMIPNSAKPSSGKMGVGIGAQKGAAPTGTSSTGQ